MREYLIISKADSASYPMLSTANAIATSEGTSIGRMQDPSESTEPIHPITNNQYHPNTDATHLKDNPTYINADAFA